MRRLNKKSRYKIIGFAVALLVLILMILYKISIGLKPYLISACDVEARSIANETINKTIQDEFGSKICYDDIMNVKTDNEGNVVMIKANTVELNRLGSQIAIDIQNRISSLGEKGIRIPVGFLFKNDLFAYLGPKISFKIQPIGSTSINYSSDFKAAGINQTRQIIYLNVTSNIQVIVPLFRNVVTVTSNIPIAESIIVGKVPNSYANIEDPSDLNGLTNYGVQKK